MNIVQVKSVNYDFPETMILDYFTDMDKAYEFAYNYLKQVNGKNITIPDRLNPDTPIKMKYDSHYGGYHCGLEFITILVK